MADRLLPFPDKRVIYNTKHVRGREYFARLTEGDLEFFQFIVPCDTCGQSYEPSFFKKVFHGMRTTCNGCISHRNAIQKQRFRWRSKIGASRNKHSKRSLSIPALLLRDKYGWNDAAAAFMEREYETGQCPDCFRTYKDIGGPAVITIDILDSRAPFWGLGTRLCCNQCNSKRGSDKDHETWARTQRNFRRWVEAYQRRCSLGVAHDPQNS